MKRPLALLLALTLPASALAQGFTQSPAYKECTELATSNPTAALAKAEEWLKIDASYAAQHCHAMALYGLSRFAEAGDELAVVRQKIPAENIALRTYVTRQGVKALVAAGKSDGAIALIATQINDMTAAKNDNATVGQLTAQLLLDRSKLLARYGKLQEAVQDLDHAISLSPLNDEILLARALCFEQLGDAPLAKQDAQAVLRLVPKQADATALIARLSAAK